MTPEKKDPAELLMDAAHWKGSFETSQWYANQLELVIHQVAARLCVEPAALLDGSAMDLIPDRRTLS